MARLVSLDTMLQAVCAAHLSSLVDFQASEDAGGMMLVAPPETFKSTMLRVLRRYDDAVILSDINAQSLEDIQPALQSRTIRSLVFPEFPKLFERDPRTAKNVEGLLRTLTGESLSDVSYKAKVGVTRIESRATVLGAMTDTFRNRHQSEWQRSGFYRRFVWSTFVLQNPHILHEAIEHKRPVTWHESSLPELAGEVRIPDLVTYRESREMRGWLGHQGVAGHATQHALLHRMLGVLKWWDRERGTAGRAWRIMREFRMTMGESAPMVVLGATRFPRNGRGK